MLGVLFLAMSGFALWSYAGRQDYKNNTDEKVAAAVEVAKEETSTAKDNEFLEKEKIPFDDYQGPESFGSVLIRYPKTWSAYVQEKGSGKTPIDGFFHPKYVPGDETNPAYALRVQVLNSNYNNELKRFDAYIKNGTLKAKPFKAPKVSQVTGIRFDGQIRPKVQGSAVLLPMRDKTLMIWTEADDRYLKDFDENILPNFTFVP